MPRAVRRAIVWGTMAFDSGRRRRYLFRVDPDGLLAVRVGNPLSITSFFIVAYLCLLFLWSSLGIASLLAGGALGLPLVGILDNAIARGVARQPKDEVLKSRMNHFLPAAAARAGEIEESRPFTYLRFTSDGRAVRIAIRRPAAPDARATFEGVWAKR